MSLIKKIKNSQMEARKNRDKEQAVLLTTLLSEVIAVGKNNGNRETTDKEAIIAVRKFKKSIDETITLLSDTGAESNEIEQLVLESSLCDTFLPKLMNKDELTVAIEVIISQGADNIGKVMGSLKKEYIGLYDGKMASMLVKELL